MPRGRRNGIGGNGPAPQHACRLDHGEKSFWESAIPLTIVCDAVEKAAMQLESIVEELHYIVKSCRLTPRG